MKLDVYEYTHRYGHDTIVHFRLDGDPLLTLDEVIDRYVDDFEPERNETVDFLFTNDVPKEEDLIK